MGEHGSITEFYKKTQILDSDFGDRDGVIEIGDVTSFVEEITNTPSLLDIEDYKVAHNYLLKLTQSESLDFESLYQLQLKYNLSEEPSDVLFVGDSICAGFNLSGGKKDAYPTHFTNITFPQVKLHNKCRPAVTADSFWLPRANSVTRDLQLDQLQVGYTPVFFIALGSSILFRSQNNPSNQSFESFLRTTETTIWNSATVNQRHLYLSAAGRQLMIDSQLTRDDLTKLSPHQGLVDQTPYQVHQKVINRSRAIVESTARRNCEGGYDIWCKSRESAFFKPYQRLVDGLLHLYPNARFVLLGVLYQNQFTDSQPEFSEMLANRFNQHLKALAQNDRIDYVEVGSFVKNAERMGYLMEDGTHFTEEGHLAFANFLHSQKSGRNDNNRP